MNVFLPNMSRRRRANRMFGCLVLAIFSALVLLFATFQFFEGLHVSATALRAEATVTGEEWRENPDGKGRVTAPDVQFQAGGATQTIHGLPPWASRPQYHAGDKLVVAYFADSPGTARDANPWALYGMWLVIGVFASGMGLLGLYGFRYFRAMQV